MSQDVDAGGDGFHGDFLAASENDAGDGAVFDANVLDFGIGADFSAGLFRGFGESAREGAESAARKCGRAYGMGIGGGAQKKDGGRSGGPGAKRGTKYAARGDDGAKEFGFEKFGDEIRDGHGTPAEQIEDAVLSNPSLKEFMEAEGTEPEIAADVIDLVKTFQQVLERVRTRPVLNVDEETVTVGQMIDYLRRRLSLEDRPIRLKQLLMRIPSRHALVCMFLALLEMVRLQAIQVRQEKMFGEIAIRKHTHFEEIMNEQSAVRDDWR